MASGVGAQHDLPELLGVGEARPGDRDLKPLAGRRCRLADLPGRGLHVLLPERGDHVARREIAGGHLLRIELDPRTAIDAADARYIGGTGQAGQLVLEPDGSLVAQVADVPAAIRRTQDHYQDRARRFLLDGDAALCDHSRKNRQGEGDPVLHHDLRDVYIGVFRESDLERVCPVVVASRTHVPHLFDAVDLLLDRCGHCIGHDLGVAPG